jgi:ribosome-associated translation inhibitor RaiA
MMHLRCTNKSISTDKSACRQLIVPSELPSTVVVDAPLKHFIEREVSRLLDRFAVRLTRIEVHLSDVDNNKTSKSDKRCHVEARLAGVRPLIVSAKATILPYAVDEALRKMQRSLTAFLGRRNPICFRLV